MSSVQTTRLQRIGHVELRVRNLNESARFYCDLFGLARRAATPPSGKMCVCVGAPASGCEGFSVVLTEGLPLGTDLAGLDHVGFSVPTEQDVRDTYAKAHLLGIRCTAPRAFDGAIQTFIFDPNGYKLEIMAASGSVDSATGSRPDRAEGSLAV